MTLLNYFSTKTLMLRWSPPDLLIPNNRFVYNSHSLRRIDNFLVSHHSFIPGHDCCLPFFSYFVIVFLYFLISHCLKQHTNRYTNPICRSHYNMVNEEHIINTSKSFLYLTLIITLSFLPKRPLVLQNHRFVFACFWTLSK